jgi:hypothetical protein
MPEALKSKLLRIPLALLHRIESVAHRDHRTTSAQMICYLEDGVDRDDAALNYAPPPVLSQGTEGK